MAGTVPTSPNPRPRLHLAGEGVLPRVTMMPGGNTPLSASDPRWVLAVRVASSFSLGGSVPASWAACPQRARARRQGALFGFAPHEIDAIGGIVLDAASGGGDPVGALHTPAVIDRLRAVRRPDRARERRDHVGDGVAVALGAVVLLTAVALFAIHAR